MTVSAAAVAGFLLANTFVPPFADGRLRAGFRGAGVVSSAFGVGASGCSSSAEVEAFTLGVGFNFGSVFFGSAFGPALVLGSAVGFGSGFALGLGFGSALAFGVVLCFGLAFALGLESPPLGKACPM